MKPLRAMVVASFLLGAAPALADQRALVVSVEEGSDVAEDEVRRAVDAELRAAPDGAAHLVVRSKDGVIVVTYRDRRGRTIARELTAPADGAARVRLIALLAGNLARNEAEELVKPPPAEI